MATLRLVEAPKFEVRALLIYRDPHVIAKQRAFWGLAHMGNAACTAVNHPGAISPDEALELISWLIS